jgi:purine-cytosine permease-like protein
LSLREVLTLRLTQANIKTSKRKNRIINKLTFYNTDKKPFKWHWGGFFLGLLLPFGIGMIISSLKKNERKKDRVTSAAIGTLITSIVIIVLALSSW